MRIIRLSDEQFELLQDMLRVTVRELQKTSADMRDKEYPKRIMGAMWDEFCQCDNLLSDIASGKFDVKN